MKSVFRLLQALSLLLFIPAIVLGQIQQATLRFDPATPFVGQPFTLTLDVTVNPGIELENPIIEGLPDPSLARFINFVTAGRQTLRPEGGRATDVLRYTAEGRATRPFVTTVSPLLRGQVIERVSLGFLSQMRSFPVSCRISSARLSVRDLPSPNRPADFSGAIGRFTLSGEASPMTVAPGDLVTLSYTLTGSGWLADAALVPPDPGVHFKTYPAQETARVDSPPRLSIRQVVIPLSTNAAVVATPRVVYFDPDAVAYRTATIEPFRLTFAQTATTEPAIRRIDTTPAVRPADADMARPPELALAETVAKIRQLIPLTIALILAAAVTAMLFRIRRIPAVIVGILILALGVAASRHVSRAAEARVLEVGVSVTARLAPSDRALPLFDLYPGAFVIPLEHTPGWVRVRSSDREAWIPVTSVTK